MISEFNNICNFKNHNRITNIKVGNPITFPVIEDLALLTRHLSQRFSNYRGVDLTFDFSHGIGTFPVVLHISILPPGQRVSNGKYVVMCFDKIGRGAVVGFAQSMTIDQGLITVDRRVNPNNLIDVDGNRPTTKYNNSFVNPKEFYVNDFTEQELIDQIETSLDLCLYNLGYIDTINTTINNHVRASNVDGGFDPQNSQQGKEMIAREITLRRGQQRFRNSLIKSYQSTCAISRCHTIEVLEAAHIVPYNGVNTNDVTNGILLRSDIHTLFDLGLIWIDQEYIIHIDESLLESIYAEYDNTPLNLPRNPDEFPSQQAIIYLNTQRRH